MTAAKECWACEGGPSTRLKSTRQPWPYPDLAGITLLATTVWRCPECGHEEPEIPDRALLDEAIAGAIINKPSRLLAAEIKWLRVYLGFTGEEFARQMGCDRVVVSRWENGKPMGGATDRLLRLLVALKRPDIRFTTVDIAETPRPVRIKLQATSKGWLAAA